MRLYTSIPKDDNFGPTSLEPTVPPVPVTPKVVHDFTSFVGSKAAHDIPFVFFRLISTLVDRAVYLDPSQSIN